MKVLFLDHDGVICLATEWGGRVKVNEGLDSVFDQFNAGAIKVLNEIISATDCEIVVSSDWKFNATLEEMQQLYTNRGIIKEPIDFTGTLCVGLRMSDLELNRQAEIKKWLSEHPEVKKWVAVDDLDMSNEYISKNHGTDGLTNFVHTPRQREGIKQTGKKKKIIGFLNQ